MPFEKGNQLAKTKIGMKYSKTQTWENLGMKYMSGYTDRYSDFLERLVKGEKASKEELEFMNRYEKLTEYFKPKLARTEMTGPNGKEAVFNIKFS